MTMVFESDVRNMKFMPESIYVAKESAVSPNIGSILFVSLVSGSCMTLSLHALLQR